MTKTPLVTPQVDALPGMTPLGIKPVRSIAAIAQEIRRDWKHPYFGAVPYLQAMFSLDGISDDYGYDSGKSIVLYFLSNATGWKGETARRIKAELKSMAK
jgi:hypothetical protein